MLIFLALVASTPNFAFDPQARVSEAISEARRIAYNADKADWAAIESRMRSIAATAKDTTDLLPAYAVLTYGLKDGHSFVSPPPALAEQWRARYGDRRLLPDIPPRRKPASTLSKRSLADGWATGGRIRVLVVPSVQWDENNNSAPYGNELYRRVADGADIACGYIVDLRGNTGGDMWPMVTGLSPLIGNGKRFHSKDRTGKVTAGPSLPEGKAVAEEDGKPLVLNYVTGWQPWPRLATLPVALLLDDGTMSSGEHTAIAFYGRPNTRSFGTRTYGLASNNDVIELKDGVRLFVTTSMAASADGTTWPQGIEPDVAVPPFPNDDKGDRTQAKALEWLSDQKSCRRKVRLD